MTPEHPTNQAQGETEAGVRGARDRIAQALLGVPWVQALDELESGEIADTAAGEAFRDVLALVERVEDCESALFTCWQESGADTDGARSVRDIGAADIAELATDGVTDLRRDYDEACDEGVAAEARVEIIQAVVNEQAEDDGLWFFARTAPEAYLQQELRRLHAAVEGDAAQVSPAAKEPK